MGDDFEAARPPLVGVMALRAGELLGLSLMLWAEHEFRTWVPGGTGLFDFPGKAIGIAFFAAEAFFLCSLTRATLSLKSVGAKIEFGFLVVLTLWYPMRFLEFCARMSSL